MMPKVIGIVGSPRAGGNTEQFMKIALSEIKSKGGIDTELILLKDKEIKPCIHCRVCRTGNKATCSIKDDFLPIFKKMVKADGILLGSPVYFGSAYAKLKALIERAGIISEGRNAVNEPIMKGWPHKKGLGLFRRKIGAAIVLTRRTGANFTLAELLLWFMINNFVVPGSTYWAMGLGGIKTSEGEGLSKDVAQKDIEGVETIRVLADNMAWLIKGLKGKR